MNVYAFHPEAFADLDEIWEYIAEDNIDAAGRVLADIHFTLTTLAASPRIGHRRPGLTKRPLRFHVARDEYLLAYAPDASPLWRRGDPWSPRSTHHGCYSSRPRMRQTVKAAKRRARPLDRDYVQVFY